MRKQQDTLLGADSTRLQPSSMRPLSDRRNVGVSLREIERRIRALQSLDLSRSGVSVDYLRLRLFDLLENYACRTIFLQSNVKIFRARRKPQGEGEGLFTHKKELWYPEPQYVRRLGRLNRIGQPLFYCATNWETSIFEIRPEVGDIVTVLECEAIGAASPMLSAVDTYQQLARLGVKIDEDPGGAPLRDLRKSIGDSAWRKNRLIEEFVSAEFTRNVADSHEYEYKLSIAMAELLFSFGIDSRGIDGIAYPSMRTDLIDVNIALLPRAVDRMYRPIACQTGRIVGFSDIGMPEWEPGVSKSIHRYGRIEWDLKASASE